MNDEESIKWIKSPSGVVEIYANAAHVTWTLDDLRIRLGQLVDNPATPNPGPTFRAAIEERAAVTISWRNAKILRDQLVEVIDSWEKTNGSIVTDVKLPESGGAE